MGMRKYRSHLRTTRDLGYSHSFLPYWAWAYLCLTSFIGNILPNSRHSYGMTIDPFGCLSAPGVMNRTPRIVRFWKNKSCRIWWKCILFTSYLQEWSRSRGSNRFHNPTSWVGSLKGLKIPYEGSYVFWVFLLKTILHFIQEIFLIINEFNKIIL